MKTILNYLFEHKFLNKNNARDVLINIANGQYNECEIAAFLTVYLMRSITVEELTGFRDALQELCLRVDLSEFNAIDMCGTGGDRKDSFNISTLASFVVAGAGGKVAKHGNYAVSSACGSSNVLEYLGYKFTDEEARLKKEMETAGLCFLHAPLFHPAMKTVAPIRKKLAVKTFFNILGPIVNPAFPKNQVVGVYSLELARLYNYIFQETDINFMILFSLDGYDEISLTSDVKIISRFTELVMSPEAMKLTTYSPADLQGGKTIEEAAGIFVSVLEGKGTEAQNDVTLANAAAGLKCLSPERNISDCLAAAKEALESGKALGSLKKLISVCQ